MDNAEPERVEAESEDVPEEAHEPKPEQEQAQEQEEDAATEPPPPRTKHPLGQRERRSGTQAQAEPKADRLADAPTVPEAINSLVDTIDEGHSVGAIRSDVAIDLQTILNNLRVQHANGSGDVDQHVDNLRRKITSRAQEGAIKQESVYPDRLRAGLDRLERAGKADDNR